MKQNEAVLQAMEQSGGFATLGHLYQSVLKIPDCRWGTKTPFASIRRIVQEHHELFSRFDPDYGRSLLNAIEFLGSYQLPKMHLWKRSRNLTTVSIKDLL